MWRASTNTREIDRTKVLQEKKKKIQIVELFHASTYISVCSSPPVEALTFPPTSGKSFIIGTDEAMENVLGLGDLAGLTVANEADSLAYDVSGKSREKPLLSVLSEFLFHSLICVAC